MRATRRNYTLEAADRALRELLENERFRKQCGGSADQGCCGKWVGHSLRGNRGDPSIAQPVDEYPRPGVQNRTTRGRPGGHHADRVVRRTACKDFQENRTSMAYLFWQPGSVRESSTCEHGSHVGQSDPVVKTSRRMQPLTTRCHPWEVRDEADPRYFTQEAKT